MYSRFIFLYAVRMSGWLYHDETIPKQKSTETKKRHKCLFCLYGSNRLNTVFDRVGVLHVEGFKNNVPYFLKIL